MTADQVYRILKDIGDIKQGSLLAACLSSGEIIKLSAAEMILGNTVDESILKGLTETSCLTYIPVTNITRIDLT